MYRVLAIVLMAFAICYPRIASQASMAAAPYSDGPTRAERLAEDFSAWLQQPIDRIILALHKAPPADRRGG
jgi:hypothetical protein